MGVQSAADSGVGGVNQKAAQAALRGPQEYVDRMRDAYHRRRDLLAKSLKGTGPARLVSGERHSPWRSARSGECLSPVAGRSFSGR